MFVRCAWLVMLVACSAPVKPVPVLPPTKPVAAAAPAPDRDHDGIPDDKDQCPSEPEIYNNYQDDDGCPDRGCVIVKQSPLCIAELIFFERGKDEPKIAVYATVLDNAGEAMKETVDDIQLVEVRGFRSSDEPPARSKQRASSVAQLLVLRGVNAGRLEIVDGGVGATTQPPAGQRRVELAIVQQRGTIEDSDEIVCTPMGRYFRKLTDAERAARCH